MAEYRLGIALGGGGARGFAHLGVLQALKEKNVEADIYSGTSAGAIVGALIAAGNEPAKIFKAMKKNSILDFAKLHIPDLGLMRLSKLPRFLNAHIQAEKLEDLNIPLIVAASDMLKGKVAYFDKGPLVACIQASASIPVLFSPVEIDGNVYVDGGLFDNLPYKPLEERCEIVLAVHISPIRPVNSIDSLSKMIARTFELSVNGHIREKRVRNRYVIAPKGVERFDLLDTKAADELYKIGYEHVRDMEIPEEWKNPA